MILIQLYIILNLERICEKRMSLKTNDFSTAVYHFEFRKDSLKTNDSDTAVYHFEFRKDL